MSERQQKIFEAIERERDWQDRKRGPLQDRGMSIGDWMLVMEAELNEAKQGFVRGEPFQALEEVLQVVAVGVACLEYWGVVERPEISLTR